MTVSAPEREDVAIVGMSGLFAKAPDIDTFWLNILDQVDAITDAPDDWLGSNTMYDPDCAREDIKIYTRRGGFLGDLARFDPRPFGTMPVSVIGAEPDQFLALAGTLEALADAGYDKGGFNRERTGIILGHAIHANRGNTNGFQHALVLSQTTDVLRAAFPETTDDKIDAIAEILRRKLPSLNVDTVPGLVPNMMTGRIANRLDLMGPNYIMDAACASSLMAVDAAVHELCTGRADVMLAGGVNTTTSSLVYAVFCQLDALSRSSHVRPFDGGADGTLLGEGQGIFVLKRLNDAARDGDRIYAVVKAVGSSSDGRATGLMAPRLEGEVLAMRRAYEQAGIDPATVDLIEAHGTGIPLGDRIEVEALRTVMGGRRDHHPHIALGSVKSMIGHCIPAAGAASIIKSALALHHKILPPTLVGEINPDLGINDTPFYLNTEVRPWLSAGRHARRAGINAFGFGGINSHMILEEAPGTSDGKDPGAAFSFRRRDEAALLTLCEDSREELLAATAALTKRVIAEPLADLSALALECAAQASDGPWRLAIVASQASELVTKLDAAAQRLTDPATESLRMRSGIFMSSAPLEGKVAFMFPGENSQYPNMLKHLAEASPVVRHWLSSLNILFRDERAVPHAFLLYPPPTALDETERALLTETLYRVDAGSESVFFADLALFELLAALGVRADMMVGHSAGENAALIASNTIALDEAEIGQYIRSMNAIFTRLEDDRAIPSGTLLSVGAAPHASLKSVLERHEEVHFTMDNCSIQAVLFGPDSVMETVAEELRSDGAICVKLPLSWAYHTRFVVPMADQFAALFADARLGKPRARLYSCVGARPFPKNADSLRRLIVDQYVKRVRFTDVVRRMHKDGARIFVEVGPNSTLTGFVGDILKDQPHLSVALDHPKRGANAQLLHALAQLFVHGVHVDLKALHAAGNGATTAPIGVPKAIPPMQLASALPYIGLSAAEGAEVRALLDTGGETVAVSEPPGVAAVPTAMPSPARTQAPAGDAVLSNHFKLMDELLRTQEQVTAAALGCVEQTEGTVVTDLSALFPHGPDAAVMLATWNTAEGPFEGKTLDLAAKKWLSDSEIQHFRCAIAPLGKKRRAEWLLGRISAKSAIRSWLSRSAGFQPAPVEITIGYDDQGKPIWPGTGGAGIEPSVNLSLSHKNGMAVAAVSECLIGVDLECVSSMQDVEALFGIAFSENEGALIRDNDPDKARFKSVVAWSSKEATAKALGTGLQGKPLRFTVTALDLPHRRASVEHNGALLQVDFHLSGDWVCVLASHAAR